MLFLVHSMSVHRIHRHWIEIRKTFNCFVEKRVYNFGLLCWRNQPNLKKNNKCNSIVSIELKRNGTPQAVCNKHNNIYWDIDWLLQQIFGMICALHLLFEWKSKEKGTNREREKMPSKRSEFRTNAHVSKENKWETGEVCFLAELMCEIAPNWVTCVN